MDKKHISVLIRAYGVLIQSKWLGHDTKDGQRLLNDLRNVIAKSIGELPRAVQDATFATVCHYSMPYWEREVRKRSGELTRRYLGCLTW